MYFFLVIWKFEKSENSTWESEVQLKHASDLITAFKYKMKGKTLNSSPWKSDEYVAAFNWFITY